MQKKKKEMHAREERFWETYTIGCEAIRQRDRQKRAAHSSRAVTSELMLIPVTTRDNTAPLRKKPHYSPGMVIGKCK